MCVSQIYAIVVKCEVNQRNSNDLRKAQNITMLCNFTFVLTK